MRINLFKMAVLLLSFATILSCGGGGGGGTPPSGEVEGGGYLFYTSSFYLVDKNNPSSPVEVETKPVLASKVFYSVSSYNEETGEYQGLNHYQGFFITENDNDISLKNGGKFYKISLEKADSITPIPVQVSNVSNACSINESYDDFINKKTYFVLQLAGSDGICNSSDDTNVFVHSDMTSSDSPITGKEIIYALQKLQGASISGFLVKEGNDIKKCNTTLSSCTSLLSNVVSIASITKQPGTLNSYLCIQRTGDTTGSIYKFDGNSLTPLSFPCNPTDSYDGIADNSSYYFEDDNDLKKFNFSTETVSTVYSVGESFSVISMTNNYVLIKKDSNRDIVAIKKDGSEITILINGTTEYGFGFIPLGNKVIFNRISLPFSPSSQLQACYWTEGTSINHFSNGSVWSGIVISENGTIQFSSLTIPAVERVLLIEGGNFTYPTMKEGSLKVVRVSDMSKILTLGNIPANFGGYFYSFLGYSVGNKTLLAFMDFDSGRRNDIFFVDISQSNSLTKITDTSSISEKTPFIFGGM